MPKTYKTVSGDTWESPSVNSAPAIIPKSLSTPIAIISINSSSAQASNLSSPTLKLSKKRLLCPRGGEVNYIP